VSERIKRGKQFKNEFCITYNMYDSKHFIVGRGIHSCDLGSGCFFFFVGKFWVLWDFVFIRSHIGETERVLPD
jgi:hypothetical protein